MYHAIVRRIGAAKFAEVNAGDLDRFLTIFGDDSLLCMHGDHPLGGELRGVAEARTFFERLQRVLPGLIIEPISTVVAGWPWHTTVGTRFRVRATLADGSRYVNEGMQHLELRWGKVVVDRLYEDTALLLAALAIQRSAGIEEAAAVPLGPLPAWVGIGSDVVEVAA